MSTQPHPTQASTSTQPLFTLGMVASESGAEASMQQSQQNTSATSENGMLDSLLKLLGLHEFAHFLLPTACGLLLLVVVADVYNGHTIGALIVLMLS